MSLARNSARTAAIAGGFLLLALGARVGFGQVATPLVVLDKPSGAGDFPIVADGRAAGIYVTPESPETVRVAAEAFASDVEKVSGVRPRMLASLGKDVPADVIVVGVLGSSGMGVGTAREIGADAVRGKWEAAATTVLARPMAGVQHALVIAGSDRRGAAYALFAISRAMGVSPWYWWSDVPVAHHDAVYVRAGQHVQPSPSVQYRGIFFNDEDWGLRPWAAKKMDPTVDSAGGSGTPAKGNIGPHTYEKVFELLLRLHANSLWPAMHPGSLAFNAVPENAKLADKWGIVMGSSHSEALLRNNVGEWSEKAPPEGNGRWNYQTNAAAMQAYWDKRLQENGKYENFYTVGLRGVHDSGLEATGSPEVKAKLVEDVMADQRKLLAERVAGLKDGDVTKIPQVIWLYKESLDLYRVGMKVPDDVTLGWTDDNYGYIRELPDAEEQKRAGGSALYYHVSYWGAPHDYLWLCSTPPALLQEELTKAYDHGVRKYWILNVGDGKPAEIDIDYFMQLAADEPGMAKMSQRDWLTQWFGQQFPTTSGAPGQTASSSELGSKIADVMTRYYALNFIRKPEFMGFNGYNDGVKRTAFNPLAWPTSVPDIGSAPGEESATEYPNENEARVAAWTALSEQAKSIAAGLPKQDAAAYFELVGYPVEAAGAMNAKFLFADETFLEAQKHNNAGIAFFGDKARKAYGDIESLTEQYSALEGGKWDGMMSDHPRDRHVFEMPRTASDEDASTPLPASWGAGDPGCPGVITTATNTASFFEEVHCTVSINAAHFARKSDTSTFSAKVARLDPSAAQWRVLPDLGISGDSVVYGRPGLLADLDLSWVQSGQTPEPTAWLEYDFTTTTSGAATLALHLLPTFPVDSEHKLRYAVSLDGGAPMERDASGASATKAAGAGDGPSGADWPQNVLRNSAIDTIQLGQLAPGKHTLRLSYRDPGVVFEHLVIAFPGAPPAYPVPPETKQGE